MVTGSVTGSDVRLVAGLVSMRAPLPVISGIRGLEGLVARISGYSSGIGICLTKLWIARGKGRV